MTAFHNDPKLKQFYLDRMREHRLADQLIQGIGWGHGRGCAIGCLFHCYDHSLFESELGGTEILGGLVDAIFEKLPNDEAMLWPERVLQSMVEGSDLSLVGWKFLHWLITQHEFGAFHDPPVADVIAHAADAAAGAAREAVYPAAHPAARATRAAREAVYAAAHPAARATRAAREAVYAAADAPRVMADKLIDLIESA